MLAPNHRFNRQNEINFLHLALGTWPHGSSWKFLKKYKVPYCFSLLLKEKFTKGSYNLEFDVGGLA
jgi:hypothetical protein